MRKYVVLFVMVALILVFTSLSLTGSLFVVQRLAGIHDPQGTVELKRAGSSDWRPIADIKTVKAGDTVRTGGGSSVELSWVDGTRMALAENTELVVRKFTFNTAKQVSTSLFSLRLGRIWIRLVDTLRAGSKFEVATPTATAGVRGTLFSVAVGLEGRTEISVYEGEVAVRTGERTITVPAGQKLASGREQESRVVRLSEQELDEWAAHEDIVAPFLQITGVTFSPGAGARQATVDVESEPGAQVKVGDATVDLDERGQGRAVVTVPPDAQSLRIVARDRRGVESVREVSLETGEVSTPAHQEKPSPAAQ